MSDSAADLVAGLIFVLLLFGAVGGWFALCEGVIALARRWLTPKGGI